MPNKILFVIAFHTLFGLTACSTMLSNSTEQHQINPLQNTQWALDDGKNITDQTKQQKKKLQIRFDQNKISASDGCNTLIGEYQIHSNQIKLSQLANTAHVCSDNPMSLTQWSVMLRKVKYFEFRHTELKLFDSKRNLIFSFHASTK
ncbi:META domain-containing protein [Acinetobacter shaoyimingii]|uniref:META domain-containing protein n=1 Tax=Acinetobacter shaoyimingii TaxID=2715164 RepID=A0A6G8RU77_9GAMM|nr:META domain-containing protein [Acinetobacter shaoyimingii]NHB58469.1 META domain-containing protein [Acinetobacter shaoyimingii]QIO05441.1 META domain-containing protein [Acinetobacter shaoyimingii]